MKPPSLREKAVAKVSQIKTGCRNLTPEEYQKQVHELQIFQVELEMQNEELRRAQIEIGKGR